METLQIGFVSSTYHPIVGGAETYVYKNATTLAELGHDVTVVTRFTKQSPEDMKALLTGTEPGRSYVQDGATLHVLSAGPLRGQILKAAYRLHFYEATRPLAISLLDTVFGKQLQTILSDRDIIHYSGTGRELLGFCVARLCARQNIPLVVSSHMHIGSWGDGDIDFELYRRADRMVTATEHEKSFVVDHGLSPDTVDVVGQGVNVSGSGDGERFRTKHNIDGPLFLFLGRQVPKKGFPLLLRAAPLVWDVVPNAHFAFAGPPGDHPLSNYPDFFDDLLRDARVHNLGLISDEERENAYAACDIFCLPSAEESFGMAYLEAGYYGKPVVGLHIPVLEELVEETKSGLLTEQSPESIATALIRLLQDVSLRNELGQNGQQRAQKHTWPRIAQRLSSVYRSVLEDAER